MTTLLRIAALFQLLVAVMNYPLSKRFRLGPQLALLSPVARQIYHVQHGYIVGLLVAFAALTFFFAGDLAGGQPLGAFLSWMLALFWAARLVIQQAYYDRGERRRHRAADVAATVVFGYLAAVYAFAAMRSAP